MSSSVFTDLLSAHPIVVADGAMGTSLFELGLEAGGCPELLNVEEPQLIQKVHRQFVDAGADIILTNTFGGNRCRLELHQAHDRVVELNQAAVQLARSVADDSERPVAVAASIGPTGDLYQPVGPLSYDQGLSVFTEQVQAAAAAGADVIWVETMSSLEEAAAAVDAAATVDLPAVLTMSFDTNGRTMMGVRPGEVAGWVEADGRSLVGIGANCGIGPADVVQAALAMGADTDRVIIAKANCGIPLYSDGVLSYPTPPADMADYVELAARSGARIIGSCCGSGPAHIAAIRQAVDSHAGGPPASPEEIADRLGGEVRVERQRTRGRGRRRAVS